MIFKHDICDDINNMVLYKLAQYNNEDSDFEKVANKLRDMIAMGRTPILQSVNSPTLQKIRGFFGGLSNKFPTISGGIDKAKSAFDNFMNKTPIGASLWGGLRSVGDSINPTENLKRMKSFNILRNTKLYQPYADYKNTADMAQAGIQSGLTGDARASALRSKAKAMVENAMNEQDLRNALRNKIRGKAAYNDFMQNTLGATQDRSGNWVGGRSLTSDEYAKYFGDRTAYPSLKRVAEGTMTGVRNRIADTNRKVRALNAKRIAKGQELIPEISLSENPEDFAKELGIDVSKANELIGAGGATVPTAEVPGANPGVNKIIMSANGPVKIPTYNNKTIAIGVDDNPLQKFISKGAVAPFRLRDSNIIGEGAELAAKASTIDHEFNEALNMLDGYKRHGANKALQRSILGGTPLLGDSHMSGHVLGNEFLTNNRLYGSNVASPLSDGRAALNTYPETSRAAGKFKDVADINFNSGITTQNGLFSTEHLPTLTSNSIGMDVSRLDGGFGRFKTPKELMRYLNTVMRNTNDMTNEVGGLYAGKPANYFATAPVYPTISSKHLADRVRNGKITGVKPINENNRRALLRRALMPNREMTNKEKMELINKYLQDMRWPVANGDIDSSILANNSRIADYNTLLSDYFQSKVI